MKYNYVFFWGVEDYYKYAFSDIIDEPNIRFIDGLPQSNNRLIKRLHLFHNSRAINKYINLPLKKIWFSNYFNCDFENGNPIVFVFHGSYYWLRGNGYMDYLKKTYKNSKCVVVFMDTVESYKRYYKDKFHNGFQIEFYMEKCDLLISYNKTDAETYHMHYYPSIYSKKSIMDIYKESELGLPEYDVFYIGKAKDRLNEIHEIYEKLINKGFRCDFYVTEVPESSRVREGIHYNKYLSYTEVIKHVIRSRGILEIVQKNSEGFTFRLDEALVTDRNLITNNMIVKKNPYSESPKIYMIDEIDAMSLSEYREQFNVSYDYKEEYSPVRLLQYIEDSLAT